MLSVARNWSALVSARCAHDAQQDWRSGGTSQFATTGLFLASLGIRPVVDVLWTTGVQTENPVGHFPNGSDLFKERFDLEHELIMATLSTGPVGFGDKVGRTNRSLLERALRSDGMILKPGFPAHRLDLFYLPSSPCVKAEIWSAPTVPARVGASARVDRRANSMVRLFALDGGSDDEALTAAAPAAAATAATSGVWWYNLLLYDLHQSKCTLTPAQLSPPGVSERGYVVSRFGEPCMDGTPATSCLAAFTESTPLKIETDSSATGLVSDTRLHSIAPVLSHGWVLLGEQRKYVAVSPQRLVVGRAAATQVGASDSLQMDELIIAHGTEDGDGSSLEFAVIGEAGETVDVAVVVPSSASDVAGVAGAAAAAAIGGRIVVVSVEVAEAGQSRVSCSVAAGCRVVHAMSAAHSVE